MNARIAKTVVLAMIGLMAAGAFSQNIWQGGAGTNDWYATTANWSAGHFPAAGETVVITNANVGVLLTNSAPAAGWLDSLMISNTATLIFTNWDTALSATNVWIRKSAIVTCAGPFTNAPAMSNRVYLVCSNLTLEIGGQINVNGLGYAAACGPGTPANSGHPYYYSRAGGTYGGLAGRYYIAYPPTNTYGF